MSQNKCYVFILTVETAVSNLNKVLEKQDASETLIALKNPDGNFPFIYQEASKYHRALLKEKKEGLPRNVLVIIIYYIRVEMCVLCFI